MKIGLASIRQNVFVAVIGEEALAFLADQPYDVVLADYHRRA